MKQTISLKEFYSGTVLFFLTLPLSVGISLASGAPIYSGIISSIVGGTIVLFLSKSNVLVSGPSASLVTIIFAAISQFTNFETFLYSVILAGVIQILLGLSRACDISNQIPTIISKAIIVAIGILIITKQIPHLLGYDTENKNINIACLTISLLLVPFIIINGKGKLNQKTPFIFFCFLIFSLLIVSVFYLFFPKIEIPASLRFNLPVGDMFSNTIFKSNLNKVNFSEVFINGCTLAILASLNSIIMIEAVDKLATNKQKSETNKEIIAQGIGNIVCGILGGLPISTAFTRSSLNQMSNVQTKYSTLINSLLLIITVVWLRSLFGLIPISVSALLFLFIGIKLIQTKNLFPIFKFQNFRTIVIFLITILSIVFFDLLKGFAVGFLVFIAGSVYDYTYLHKSKIRFSFFSIVKKQIKSIIVLGSVLTTFLISVSNFISYERNLINNLGLFGVIFAVAIFMFWEKRDK